MTHRTTPVNIVKQGCILISSDHALVYRSSPDVVCLYLDMASKRAKLLMTDYGDGNPRAYFEADDDTLHIDESHPRDACTIVEFPEYPGWEVFATTGPGRYTFGIVLVAPEKEPAK